MLCVLLRWLARVVVDIVVVVAVGVVGVAVGVVAVVVAVVIVVVAVVVGGVDVDVADGVDVEVDVDVGDGAGDVDVVVDDDDVDVCNLSTGSLTRQFGNNEFHRLDPLNKVTLPTVSQKRAPSIRPYQQGHCADSFAKASSID